MTTPPHPDQQNGLKPKPDQHQNNKCNVVFFDYDRHAHYGAVYSDPGQKIPMESRWYYVMNSYSNCPDCGNCSDYPCLRKDLEKDLGPLMACEFCQVLLYAQETEEHLDHVLMNELIPDAEKAILMCPYCGPECFEDCVHDKSCLEFFCKLCNRTVTYENHFR